MKHLEDPGIRPYDYFREVLGGKWKLFIIRGIIYKGFVRFNELKRITGVTEKVLQQQLRELERDGIIRRTIYPEIPPRVEYSFTPAGEELRPVMDAIYAWSLKRLQEQGADIAPLTFLYHEGSSKREEGRDLDSIRPPNGSALEDDGGQEGDQGKHGEDEEDISIAYSLIAHPCDLQNQGNDNQRCTADAYHDGSNEFVGLGEVVPAEDLDNEGGHQVGHTSVEAGKKDH